MTFAWRRDTGTSSSLPVGSSWLHAIPAGQTYIRCRFRWGFYGDSSILTDLGAISSNIVTFGLVTTIGNGSETPPNARSGSGDVSPPTERWIYWETRAPVISAISHDAGVVAWRDAGSTEQTDTKGQVLATGLPGGDTLNLWASWASVSSWDSSGSFNLWFGISMLTKSLS